MRAIVIAILVIVGVWTLSEVHQHGVAGAFGGVLGNVSSGLDAPASQATTSDRTADAFQRAYNKSESRVDHLLDQPGAGD